MGRQASGLRAPDLAPPDRDLGPDGAAHRSTLNVVAAIALPAFALAALAWSHRWTSDDAFIHFRVVDQLLHGNGPVFNAGERVEASTSVAWVMILAAARIVTFAQIRLEYLALFLALGLSVAGLVLASLAALRIVRTTDANPATIIVPFGSLVVVGIRAFWDFSTAGLEMGLVFAWLGACFLASLVFADARAAGRVRRRWPIAMLLGIGPLIRPDLLLFSICFVAAMVLVDRPRRWWRHALLVATAFALPLAYEIFRMGYYAELIPNPAIAKSASGSQWSRGVHYLSDLLTTYQLWLPLLLLALATVFALVALVRSGHSPNVIVVAAVLLGAALHTIYIVRVGGDFMHARLLLPALFAVTMPVAIISVRLRTLVVAACVMGAWAFVSGAHFRFDTHAKRADAIDDERETYIVQSHVAHPVTVHDYAKTPWVAPAIRVRERLHGHERVLVVPASGWYPFPDPARTLSLGNATDERIAFASLRMGAASFAAGTKVYIVDRFGLGDPIGSHLTGEPLVKPGHDKYLPLSWIEGRYASAASVHTLSSLERYGAQLAHNALGCPAPARLLRDVDAPLTLGRFFHNVVDARRNTALGIPYQPKDAVAALCGTQPAP